MILDKILMFFDEALASAGNATSKSYPLAKTGSISREAAGEPMELVVQMVGANNAAGGTSLEFRLVSANNDALSSPVTQQTTGAIALANLVKGAKFKLPLDFPTADPDASHFGVTVTAVGSFSDGEYSVWIQRAGEDQHTIND